MGGTERVSANRAAGRADWANGFLADVAEHTVLCAKEMSARLDAKEIIRAEELPALLAALTAAWATRRGTGATLALPGDNGIAVGATCQTVEANGGIGRRMALVEARPDLAPALDAGDDAILAEALPAGGARCILCAILLAARATDGARATNQRVLLCILNTVADKI